MTPLLLLKIIRVLTNFMIFQTFLNHYFSIFRFMATPRPKKKNKQQKTKNKNDEIWDLVITHNNVTLYM